MPAPAADRPALPFDALACPLAGTQLIEASAGTGKTWNLGRLYLRLLLEQQLGVRQILVVTFTNAATAELRERLRQRLVEAIAVVKGQGGTADPFVADLLGVVRERHGLGGEELLRRLDEALQSFDEAAIFTIHGFCQRALGELPFASGAPLALELIADDAELRLEAVHDAWRRHFSGAALPAYVARHLLDCNDSPARHAELLQKVLAKPLSQVLWPSELDDAATRDVGDDSDAEIAALHREARRWWRSERDEIVGRVLAARAFSLNKQKFREGRIESARDDWDAYLATTRATPIPPSGDLRFLGLVALKPNAGKPPVREHPFYVVAQALVDAHERQRQSAALARLRLLRTLLAEAAASLRIAKQARRVVTFDDLLAGLHERLTGRDGPTFAAALRERYPAALIDEFQDTDPLQFAIFRSIYGEGDLPLFLVGDPKQAIYSFRNADLHTYLVAQREAAALYTLTDNQRSSAPLLAALNALFTSNDAAFMLPGLAYRVVDFGTRTRPELDDRSAARASLQLWSLPADDEGNALAKERAEALATDACAGEIARLLAASQAGSIRLDGRPLAGGDIAVLVRTNLQGAAIREALSALGVASVQLAETSLFASREAADVELILGAVLEPTRLPRLRAALAGDSLGYDATAIDALAHDEAGLLALVARFAEYRRRWLQRGCGAMLRELFAREDVAGRLLAYPDGDRRLTNLRHLAEVLQQAAERHPAPEALLRWLQGQRSVLRVDEANQLRLESDRNLVQIVTIHKAKGLEYGIVFCPHLWQGQGFRNDQARDLREYHDAEHRPVLDFRGSVDDEATREAVGRQLGFERACEDLRLIYVALTRAVHRCYLVTGSYVTRPGSSERSRAAPPNTTESHRAVLHWLVAGQGQNPEQWLRGKPSLDEIARAWQRLAAEAATSIGLAPLPDVAIPPLIRAAVSPASLAALAPPRSIPPAWWVGSYSSLTHGTRHEGAAVDHDLLDSDSTEPSPVGDAAAAAIDADDVLRFPRGPEAGQCLHAVFERVDFSDPSGWPAAIDAALRGQARHLGGAGSAPLLRRMLARMLADVVATRLPGELRLAEVPPHHCLVELEFNLPARGFDVGRLEALLRSHDYPVPPFAFANLTGYLRGFIDLVFEQRGRFHIVDWKSNHLGDSVAAYAEAALAAAMVEHAYHVQALLYTVAVHRYLGRRLPGYRYETHFGSVLYLFVRGVRPQWLQDDGRPAGVHVQRPPLRLIEALSALLGDTAPALA